MPDNVPPPANDSPKAYTPPAGGTPPPAPTLPPVAPPADPLAPASGEPKKGDPPPAAPPAEVEIKVPKDFNADPELLKSFQKLASESGLKSDAAQKVFDMYTGIAQKEKETLDKQVEAWGKQLKAEPDFEKNMALAKKALVHLSQGPQAAEVRAIFEDTWIGQHPGVVAMLVKAGKAIGEDQLIEAEAPAPPPSDPAKTLFGGLFKNP